MNVDARMRIIRLEEVDSTNNYMSHLPMEKQYEVTVVTAERQTHGRGQGDHHWESKAGENITMSLRFCPKKVKADEQFVISMAVALAVAKTVEHYIDNVRIKWPNDIYVGKMKIAGILIENHLRGKEIADSVVGIGLNVNQTSFDSDAPNPISLKMLTHQEQDREEVLQLLLINLSEAITLLEKPDKKDIEQAYHMKEYKV